MNYENILVERDGFIVKITFNRPKSLNALNSLTLRELENCLTVLQREEKDETRVVILAGAGEKAFVAGADISEMNAFGVEEARIFAELGHRVLDLIAEAHFPVIASISGFALGGGCEIMLACDLAYASEKARLGQPEVNLGVIPGFGGTQRLIRRVGLARAREIIYGCDMINAQKAKEIGLVLEVFPHEELEKEVRAVAEKIASKPPLAVAQAKRVTELGYDESLRAANELEQQAFALLFGTEDQGEGMKAFVEKRKADFKGR